MTSASALLAAHAITPADADVVAIDDVSAAVTGGITMTTLRGYMADNTYLSSVPVIAGLSSSMATATANIAALSTQASLVASRGIGSDVVNSTTVSSDLYNGDATVTMNAGDKLTYQHSLTAANFLPVTDKTSVVITTVSGNSTVTATSGTFASTDTDRMIAVPSNTQIPASTYLVFTDSTHATLKNSAGTAVNASASGTGITTTISSPAHTISLLNKVFGANGFQYDLILPPTGTGVKYLVNYWMEFTVGSDGLHHTAEGHHRSHNANSTNSNTSPAIGLVVPEVAWLTSATATDYGTTRQSIEHRLNSTRLTSSSVYLFTRITSSLYITRA